MPSDHTSMITKLPTRRCHRPTSNSDEQSMPLEPSRPV